jgi:hypothetical protein
MRSLLRKLAGAFALSLVVWLSADAVQQPPKPARPKAPRLTTDDVLPSPASQPPPEAKEATAKPDETAKADASEVKPEQPKATEVKVSEEESSWRERVGKARNRATETERAAEEAELRVTQLRNELGTSGQTARYRNETIAELGNAGQRVLELRAQARAAADDAAQLIDYGRQKVSQKRKGRPPLKKENRTKSITARNLPNSPKRQSAQRRVQLYDNRVAI